jgi:hypothetical protein
MAAPVRWGVFAIACPRQTTGCEGVCLLVLGEEVQAERGRGTDGGGADTAAGASVAGASRQEPEGGGGVLLADGKARVQVLGHAWGRMP